MDNNRYLLDNQIYWIISKINQTFRGLNLGPTLSFGPGIGTYIYFLISSFVRPVCLRIAPRVP